VLGSSDSSHLGKPRESSSIKVAQERTSLWQPPKENRELEKSWQPPIVSTTPSLLQSLFSGLSFTLPPLFSPITLAPPITQRPPIQNFFAGRFPDSGIPRESRTGLFGREDRFAGAQNSYTPAITPIPFTLATLQSPLLGFSLGVPFAASNRRPFHYDRSELTPFTSTTITTTTVAPATTITPTPRYINYNSTRRPIYATDAIRDWRKRFYKLFKSNKYRNYTLAAPTQPTFEPVQLPTQEAEDIIDDEPMPKPDSETDLMPDSETLPRPDSEPERIMIFERKPHYTRRMQPIIIVNDTQAAEVDKNRQILLSKRNPNLLSAQTVKTFARDEKGRIIRLFGVETGGYKYDEDPIPPISDLQNSDYYQGVAIAPPGNTVYIPAGIPSTLAPPPPAYRIYRPALPPATEPPIYQSPQTLETAAPYIPQLVSSLPLSSFQFPTLAPTPPPCSATTVDNSRVDRVPNNYANSEYDVLDDLPCETVFCRGGNSMSMNPMNPIIHGNDIGPPFIENNEKCNSLRLRNIIQESIVGGDAEASKRVIQARAETELISFYNVICGTGFFSYIAHTDEFCQASALDINCYVFSPVCSYKTAYSDGILKSRARLRKSKKKAAFLNRN
uniref:Ground-like domain-containing protein n=1 Tax=Acrobeloides nanus TaxID=290746 RepID=A0A914CLT2_9BILA